MAADDAQQFAEFVALRSPALQRTAYLIVGDVGAAEDLVREALTRTWMAWPRLRDPYRAEAYARTAIATRAVAGSRRTRARAGVPATAGAAAGPATPRPDDVDERTWFWRCLLLLPVPQRAAIVLRYYEDLTERETAEAMGCAIGVARSELAAGLATLRPLVSPHLLPREVAT